MIIKWLGLDTLSASMELSLELLRNENAGLRKEISEISEKLEEIEEPDLSDYISESDIDDRIETYCNDNDIPNKEWVESEIDDKIDDKVKEAIEEAGIEEQVRDLFNDASPSPMSEEDIKAEIKEQVESAFDDLGEGDKLIDRIIEEYENVQAVRIQRAVDKAMKKAVKPKAKAKPKKK